MTPLLEVRDLGITHRDGRHLVEKVEFSIERGEVVALVGESGSGKTLTALSLLGLLPRSMRLDPRARILLDGEDIAFLRGEALRAIRGARIAMIFQDPFASLNPAMRIGDQIIEAITAHDRVARGKARARTVELLEEVGIADPHTRIDAWPHQLSGGMRQRVMIAAALAGSPDLLVADEPTTALDAPIQAQILALLDRLSTSRGLATLLVSHDLGMVADHAERVLVMHRGSVVESAPTDRILAAPVHQHTRALLAATPRLDQAPPQRQSSPHSPPVVTALNLVKEYPLPGGMFTRRAVHRAVDGVSFSLSAGEIVGLVGESGSGKSTLGRLLLMLEQPTSGTVQFGGQDITRMDATALRALRKRMQLVFQDASGALNPRRKVADSIAEGLRIHRMASPAEQPARVAALMEEVGLDPALGARLPGQLSGGQRQRVGIARALAVDPEFLVADESVSSLDTTVQAQILELLLNLRERRGVACLFIAHDLAVVRQVADRIAVMKDGRIVELGSASQVIEAPAHPYTAELLQAGKRESERARKRAN